jgi:hypothetical protein
VSWLDVSELVRVNGLGGKDFLQVHGRLYL